VRFGCTRYADIASVDAGQRYIGQSQKAKMGGFPHYAPLGYVNLRQTIRGRTVAHMVPDPDRASLIRKGFER
jgi:hypothetical protein